MAGIKPSKRDVEVVLVGRFNPAIIQPGWLTKYGIVGEDDAKSAQVTVVHPDLTSIKFALFELVVETGKFAIKTRDIHPEIVQDFLLKTFGQFLVHTPIHLLGINYRAEIECPSTEARDAFGRRLAPREPWGAWGKMIEGDADPHSPAHGGLFSISMKQGKRPDAREGFIAVRLDVAPTPKSIFMSVNDHYTLGDDVQDASKAVEILEKCWNDSLKFSEFVISETTQQILETMP